MTDQEIREAAANFAETILGIPAKQISPDDTIIAGFTAGAKWAEKESYNAALNDAYTLINNALMMASNSSENDLQTLLEELQKLRK